MLHLMATYPIYLAPFSVKSSPIQSPTWNTYRRRHPIHALLIHVLVIHAPLDVLIMEHVCAIHVSPDVVIMDHVRAIHVSTDVLIMVHVLVSQIHVLVIHACGSVVIVIAAIILIVGSFFFAVA